MKLHNTPTDRQKAAQTGPVIAEGLAWNAASVSVGVAVGTTMPAPVANHLFRTPSLYGQISVPHTDLPVFFRPVGARSIRRGSAHHGAFNQSDLQAGAHGVQLRASGTKQKNGWAGCELQDLSRRWHCAWAWRRVETRRRNRFSTAAAQAWSDRHCWTATWLPAQRSVRPQTSSIARKTPAPAESARACDYLTTWVREGPGQRRCSAAPGLTTRGGVLRAAFPQTKDDRCSTKS